MRVSSFIRSPNNTKYEYEYARAITGHYEFFSARSTPLPIFFPPTIPQQSWRNRVWRASPPPSSLAQKVRDQRLIDSNPPRAHTSNPTFIDERRELAELPGLQGVYTRKKKLSKLYLMVVDIFVKFETGFFSSKSVL